jgi:hypothetical protein
MKKISFLFSVVALCAAFVSCGASKSVIVRNPTSGSTIRVDGNHVGGQEATFKVTKYSNVSVSAPNYFTKNLTINSKSPFITEVSLERDPNTLARDYTIKTNPVDAVITIDGTNVAKGQYTISLYKSEFKIADVSREGYFPNSVTVKGTDSPGIVNVNLIEDDAWYASVPSSDIANKNIRINARSEEEDDDIWYTMMRYASDYFGDFTVNDKNIGWAKSTWVKKTFSKVVIRTRLEIKRNPGNRKEFTIFLASEWTNRKDCNDDECFQTWDRVLKTYVELPNALKNAIE